MMKHHPFINHFGISTVNFDLFILRLNILKYPHDFFFFSVIINVLLIRPPICCSVFTWAGGPPPFNPDLRIILNFSYTESSRMLVISVGKITEPRVTGCRFVQFKDSYTWQF